MESSLEGKKSIVMSMISIKSWFGGRNMFLGTAHIIVGVLCMVMTILLFVKHKRTALYLGDTRYLIRKDILKNDSV